MILFSSFCCSLNIEIHAIYYAGTKNKLRRSALKELTSVTRLRRGIFRTKLSYEVLRDERMRQRERECRARNTEMWDGRVRKAVWIWNMREKSKHDRAKLSAFEPSPPSFIHLPFLEMCPMQDSTSWNCEGNSFGKSDDSFQRSWQFASWPPQGVNLRTSGLTSHVALPVSCNLALRAISKS